MLTIKRENIAESKVYDAEGAWTYKYSRLIVNGILDENSSYLEHGEYALGYLENSEVIKIITKYSIADIGKLIRGFHYYHKEPWWDGKIKIVVCCNDNKYSSHTRISIYIILQFESLTDWNKPWSIEKLSLEFIETINKNLQPNVTCLAQNHMEFKTDIGLEFTPDIYNMLEEEIEMALSTFHLILENTIIYLSEEVSKDYLLTYFYFPEEIKVACRQYLLYFTQFLLDIGINTYSELKEINGRTLFKIIPKNKNEALDRISEALYIYLQAPSFKDIDMQISNYTDNAIKQWVSNINHLKNQLSMTIIEKQNSTIELLELSNFQYKQILENQNKKKDEEDIIKGIVSLKKLEGAGFSINLPEILRRLKRMIRK